MIRVQCVAERKLFPPSKEDELGFMLCAYRALDRASLPTDAQSDHFVAKGALLPYSQASTITLIGDQWERKDGEYTLNCTDYEESVPNSISGAMRFLETLPGCEQNDAHRIVNAVTDKEHLISVLDHDDGTIFKKAIKNAYQAERIFCAYMLRRVKKEAFFYALKRLPKGSTAQMAADIAVAATSLPWLKENPFNLVISGVMPYSTAKKIAKENSIPVNSQGGVEAAIIDVLMQNEGQSSGYAYDEETVGNTYTDITALLQKAANVVGISDRDPILRASLDSLSANGHCVVVQNMFVYRAATYAAEYGIANEISRLMDCEIPQRNYTLDIYALENKKEMRVAPEQRRAIKTALSNPVTLLIGGPGTGKTTIEQFIIEIYRLYNNAPVLLLAPTGKAARRMSESTGEPANTIHKGLGVAAGTETIVTDTVLDAGLILVDEASMLDAQVAHALFKAIKQGTQLVVVGDTNQLPSVGAGNVLYELIGSGVVPIAGLQTVYRQAAGSTIAVNCARIKRGATDLEYSDTFTFVEAISQEDAVEKVIDAYKAEMAAGLTTEDICLLSPYRRSTPTGVNQLNADIQHLIMTGNIPSLKYGQKTFFLGDKVMCLANQGDVANGDVGYITNLDENKKRFDVDFGDGRVVEYRRGDLRNFDLAYGISIHKSQGAEFKTCIIVLMDEHKAMLKRNLIYTAVSRAKQKVILVGTTSALETAILSEDVTKRHSRLGDIVKSSAKKSM